jgi:hypothetical protein
MPGLKNTQTMAAVLEKGSVVIMEDQQKITVAQVTDIQGNLRR